MVDVSGSQSADLKTDYFQREKFQQVKPSLRVRLSSGICRMTMPANSPSW